jgi:hypothetical protein
VARFQLAEAGRESGIPAGIDMRRSRQWSKHADA